MTISRRNRFTKKVIDGLKNHHMSWLNQTDRGQVEKLLMAYYHHISLDDLEKESLADLIGAVVAHWQLLCEYQGDEPRIRVYNPNFEEHGWQSQYTVVEVVSNDMAFLVDSLTMGLNEMGLTINLTIHPVIYTRRDKKCRLVGIADTHSSDTQPVSMIRFQMEKQNSSETLAALQAMVYSVIADVHAANRDWLLMKLRLQEIQKKISKNRPPVDTAEFDEANAFLQWMGANHFTFLAYCEYDIATNSGKVEQVLDQSSTLGLLKNVGEDIKRAEDYIPTTSADYLDLSRYLVVTKSSAKSAVHRPAFMDFVALKRYDSKGNVNGLYYILGLFTSAAYSSPPKNIPLLRQKRKEIFNQARLSSGNHSGRVLDNILTTYPRDDLFQLSVEQLLEISLGMLNLQERQRTRIFVSQDIFKRYYSCLFYLPKDRYDQEVCDRIRVILQETFGSNEIEIDTFFSESILARIHYVVHLPAPKDVVYDQIELESRVIEATATWHDGFRQALSEQYGEEVAGSYYQQYMKAFPSSFREDFYPRIAASDVARIERARESDTLGLSFYRPILSYNNNVHFRLYSVDAQVSLSEVIPILEHMGLTVFGESPYRIRHPKGPIWIHDFSMLHAKGVEHFTEESNQIFQEAFLKVWQGEMDSDGFNRLVLDTHLNWKQVVLLRAYSRYLKQINVPYSQSYIIESLAQNPDIVKLLVDLFELKFNPSERFTEVRFGKLLARFESKLEAVSSLDQDRILRAYVNLVQATLWTNFYQSDDQGNSKNYISFKFDPSKIDGMPLPKPMFEIFVFSSRMEGVHLRGGKVARGGLRWSDRREDFRTEILGLMKAQMVKNTVIVPVGSKGGFIVKSPPAKGGREKLMEEVVSCYRILLKGMLDITDNLVAGAVVHPEQVQRYDGDDPYLVVAADKGTATFSDIANQVSADYNFWLGDAFASGGSVGYDHKKMGITARGAWESVKRNFREIGVDTQVTDFRVIGVGDMSGDVFGNGMLLSRHIKLVGAFNHMHIFLDPEPDTAMSYKERQRLFKLPRSSWMDYNKSLISRGGGIYSRNTKAITLSDEVKVMLGVKANKMTPNELIHTILKSKVDLFWNGGIGTYVKASNEAHIDVGDKANDNVRVDGNELCCKVVGEGGNLGFTQLGRIEYAQSGGLIYTDAIDNSAGVDCSDQEVNIKILLGQVVANGDMTQKQRNRMLARMTDEVAELVLADNYAQTQAISVAVSEAPQRLHELERFMDFLESQGRLDRTLEFLPDKSEIAKRHVKHQGLTKPEVAVLHAYSKMTYYDALVNSNIPDDEFLCSELANYFPKLLGETFGKEMLDHRLKREIIATHLTNSIVDHIGPGFGYRVREEVGTDTAGVTPAYLSASRIFATDTLWHEIEQLDNQVPAATQLDMMRQIVRMLERTVIWILQTRPNQLVIRDLVNYFREGVATLSDGMPKPLSAKDRLAYNKRIKKLMADGVPREVAQKVSTLELLSNALDIVEVATENKKDVIAVASIYFNLGEYLQINWVRKEIAQLGVQSHWHNIAKTRLAETLSGHQRGLTAQITRSTKGKLSTQHVLDTWAEKNTFPYERHMKMLSELKVRQSVDFAMLSVAVVGAGALMVAQAD
ncbi:MAG: NAD-glutamate dehydrogenase [Sedimenticola sp.]